MTIAMFASPARPVERLVPAGLFLVFYLFMQGLFWLGTKPAKRFLEALTSPPDPVP